MSAAYVQDADFTLYVGDVRDVLAGLPDGSVDCVVTSPPYWGLRDYGTGQWDGGDADCDHRQTTARKDGGRVNVDGFNSAARPDSDKGAMNYRDTCGKCGARRVDRQLGLESSPDEYVAAMVAVFREVRRVLAAHGTCFLNLGDSYANKQRQMMPARVALALQADGWWLRSEIVWFKSNPMPASVTDRPTDAHEMVYLLAKGPRYYFDAEAVREEYAPKTLTHRGGGKAAGKVGQQDGSGKVASGNFGEWDKPRTAYPPPRPQEETLDGSEGEAPRGPDGRRTTAVKGGDGSIQHRDGERWPNGGRNVRSVWEIATQPYPEAHFATYPEELVRRCIAAGCPEWVCGTCGKPRERIVEQNVSGERHIGPKDDHPDRNDAVSKSNTSRLHSQYFDYRREHMGWSDCGHGNYRPGVVFDPFMGSGTTALVARRLGRRSVGIELNEEYARMCAQRLQQLSLLAEGAA